MQAGREAQENLSQPREDTLWARFVDHARIPRAKVGVGLAKGVLAPDPSWMLHAESGLSPVGGGTAGARERRRVEVMGPLAGMGEIFPGPRDFALLHERAMPQKDQLCGAFWGALTLSAAGHATSQEEVALRAGTTLAEGDPASWLPPGAAPRTDYEATIPVAPDGASAGTSATGVARSIEELSGGTLTVVPVAGVRWSAATLASLVEITAATAPECALIANLRTGCLWGSRPPARLLLDHLLGLPVEAPPPDWDCGHFLTVAACIRGPGGALVALRDTYPQLGWNGYHLQPAGAVAAALERGDGWEGGVLCACETPAAEALAGRLEEAGFMLRHWDNGSPDRDGDENYAG